MMSEFKKKFSNPENGENLKDINMTDLFKTGVLNHSGFPLNTNDFNQFLTNFDRNSFLLSSFGLAKNYNNMNMNLNIPLNNVKLNIIF